MFKKIDIVRFTSFLLKKDEMQGRDVNWNNQSIIEQSIVKVWRMQSEVVLGCMWMPDRKNVTWGSPSLL